MSRHRTGSAVSTGPCLASGCAASFSPASSSLDRPPFPGSASASSSSNARSGSCRYAGRRMSPEPTSRLLSASSAGRATPFDFFRLPSQLSSRTAACFARYILPSFPSTVTAPVTPHYVSGGIFPHRVPRLHPDVTITTRTGGVSKRSAAFCPSRLFWHVLYSGPFGCSRRPGDLTARRFSRIRQSPLR